ncbi:protein NIM1-INTERACTING 1-like [Benincasa hispida]|uniref:protein NIM1-INTERACTING 1-like n=1 Tax=Benincasa hispida TaxID=102211 RepID=UPI001901FC3B|nr:protein NIM1-INTERACTING 1-like [Benincasa hispida]
MENEKLQPAPERIAEEEEEEEMEMFFALVRNFKEMRDRRRKELMIGEEEEIAAEEKRRKRMKSAPEAVENRSTWIPKFEREDFDEEFQVRGQGFILPNKPYNLVKEDTSAAAASTAAMKKKKNVKNGDDCLDLNLAL